MPESKSKSDIFLIIDGNLLARKSFYKFSKLRSFVNLEDLSLLSKKIDLEKRKKIKDLKESVIEQEEKLEEIISKNSGNKVIVKKAGRIEKKLHKLSALKEPIPIHTGVLYGMLRSIIAACIKYPDIKKVIICYDPITLTNEEDSGRKQIRSKKYKKYKNRKKDPGLEEVFFSSLSLAISFFYKIGIEQVTSTMFEADDILQYYTHKKFKDKKIFVLTNDHDLFQILEEGRVSLYRVGGGKEDFFTEKDFRKKFLNISPKRYKDVLAVGGCSTDNVKGIKGISKETAVRLISQFKSVKKLISNYKGNVEPRIEKVLDREKEDKFKNLRLSAFLVNLYGLTDQLEYNLKIIKSKKDYRTNYKIAKIFLSIIEFKSFLTKSSLKSIKRLIINQKD